MGVRTLYDPKEDAAVLYCSTSMVAFGPLFTYDHRGHEAEERAEAFLKWLDATPTYKNYEKTQIGERRDVRCLTEHGLQLAYCDWLAQEDEQFKALENVD